MPLISVVTAVHNQRQWLPRRVESILNQSLLDWEWIIVDDASTDGSYEYLESIARLEPRIKLLRNDCNCHISKTNQRGIDAASGEFLYRTDGDDYCFPEFLARASQVLQEDPFLAFMAVRCLRLDERDRVSRPWPAKPNWRKSGREVFESNIASYQFRSPSLMFRTDVVRQAGGFDSLPVRSAQDWNLALRATMLGDARYIDEPLTAYRYHDGMTSVQGLSKMSVSQWMDEHFLPIDDNLARGLEVWPDLDVDGLRHGAYWVHAGRMSDNAARCRSRGQIERAEEITEAVREKMRSIGVEWSGRVAKPSLKARAMKIAHDLVPKRNLAVVEKHPVAAAAHHALHVAENA